jgi:putative mRNA 3-end processing factor
MKLLCFDENGIYCEKAGVYIDPWKPVDKAIITHGHSDHARAGHKAYASTPETALIMQHRLGFELPVTAYKFGEVFTINGVQFSFHPAGHIVGSAQVRVSYKGEVWVASGDYKTQKDPIATAFQPIKCHHFITESTFGLPIFRWGDEESVIHKIKEWVKENAQHKTNSVLLTYALGKAQRLLASLKNLDQPIFVHGAIDAMQQALAPLKLDLAKVKPWQDYNKKEHAGSLILTTPGSTGTSFLNRFKPFNMAMASGWMAMRGTRRRRGLDRGFVLSDHADWNGLISAVNATEAENIYVTHGYQSQFARYLQEQGLNAVSVETLYETETE